MASGQTFERRYQRVEMVDQRVGTQLLGRPGTNTGWQWWAARPFWFLAPAIVFAAGFRLTRFARRRTMRLSSPAAVLDA